MFGFYNVKSVLAVISDPTADSTPSIWYVPERCNEISLTEAWAEIDTAIASAAGTGIALTLLDFGTAGTANLGTLTSILGGTGHAWVAGAPQAFTLVSAPQMSGGRYLKVKYDETGTIAPLNISIGWNWVNGK